MSSRTRTLSALFVLIACLLAAGHRLRAAGGNDRAISIYNIHTKETLSVEYKKDGRFLPEAMKKINWIMRDWRKDEVIEIDPGLIDLLWEVHSELGSKAPIHLICGHRSRGTNDMLRRTVGGQASESRHISGKAADVSFPDVPVRQLRYSALIRERGGVGYYPTSAIPFVHMDTDAVRHWPRMPRYELALLFPNGMTKHQPADGGALTKEDVKIAREAHRELATQVAQFLSQREVAARVPGIAVASAAPPSLSELASRARMALGSPVEPRLAAEPKLIERASRFRLPDADDREKLAQLAAPARFPQLVSEPRPATRGPAPSGSGERLQLASIDHAAALPGWGSDWSPAPAFDDEHPDELSYRPFPIGPLLTQTPSPDDPVLAVLTHPEIARTLDLLDQQGAILPMRLRPGLAVARRMWVQEFRGGAVKPAAPMVESDDASSASIMAKRHVRTATQ